MEGLLQGQIENPNRRVVKPKKLSQLEDTSGGSTTAAAASSTTGTDKPGKLIHDLFKIKLNINIFNAKNYLVVKERL